MRLLVIPDVHLKPWVFEVAASHLRDGRADMAACLMDVADDWGKGTRVGLYLRSYEAAAEFAREFPDTAWVWGNHDLSYLWGIPESGFSGDAVPAAREGIRTLREAAEPALVRRVGRVVLSHGGVKAALAESLGAGRPGVGVDDVIEAANRMGPDEAWDAGSPIWARPGVGGGYWRPEGVTQVMGHTPVPRVSEVDGVIACDTLSTSPDGSPLGDGRLAVVDTETGGFGSLPGRGWTP